jgi:molybdopterin molybdotransferase
VISVADALAIVLADTPCLAAERAPLLRALGRVAAEDVVSLRVVPSADNSAMDGYAVRAADLTSAPVRLRLLGVAPAGTLAAEPVQAGTAYKIFTGSVVPPGADTVVKVEDTTESEGFVTITTLPAANANVRYAGEDIAHGAVVVRAGTRLGPADLGVLASVGRGTVAVRQRPRVAILSTGAELVEVDVDPGPGQVVNSNAYSLAAAVLEAGGVPVLLPIVRDRREEIRAALADAAHADVVLSSGGVSVGDFDFVKEELDALGVARRFWRVAQKPGKPLTFGRREQTLFFGLPGNPVSALVCFYVYVRPVLRKLAGHGALHLPLIDATLTRDIKTAAALTEFVRVQLEHCAGEWTATPLKSQSSGALSAMSAGAGLLVVPPGTGRHAAGSRHPALMLSPEGFDRA